MESVSATHDTFLQCILCSKPPRWAYMDWSVFLRSLCAHLKAVYWVECPLFCPLQSWRVLNVWTWRIYIQCVCCLALLFHLHWVRRSTFLFHDYDLWQMFMLLCSSVPKSIMENWMRGFFLTTMCTHQHWGLLLYFSNMKRRTKHVCLLSFSPI